MIGKINVTIQLTTHYDIEIGLKTKVC